MSRWFIIHKHQLPERREAANRLLLAAMLFVGVGLFLIIRGDRSISTMDIARGRLDNVRVDKLASRNGSYCVCYKLNGLDEEVGIYTGTGSFKYNDIQILRVGNFYTFYLDQTVSTTLSSCRLGVRRIESEGTVIFEDDGQESRTGGMLFVLLGMITLIAGLVARLWLKTVERRLENPRRHKRRPSDHFEP
jgi:hypothetical protein